MRCAVRIMLGLASIAAGTAVGMSCGDAVGLIAFVVLTVGGTGAVSFSCCRILDERGYI